MIIYEVTAEVRPDLCAEYESYMTRRHIPDLLATGTFASASLELSVPGSYRARYKAATREDLERYLSEHAPRLREDFSSHFSQGIEVSRDEWRVLKHFA